jgi:undecaprenyl-diphosphatase
MAVLAESGSNPDVAVLYDINGLAERSPHWFDRGMEFMGEYGLLLVTMLMVLGCWWSVRRRPEGGVDEAASSVAALIWAPLAAAVAVLVNVPIRGFVKRPRPFIDHQGLDVLLHGKSGYSFVSDHATITMALGVGLFLASRRFGIAGIALALVEGFSRVYMGVHYPTDVMGGFALGTAVALLLSPLAMALLTPVTRAVARSPRAGWLIHRYAPEGQDGSQVPDAQASLASGERDLAA